MNYFGNNILDTHEETAYILDMKAPHTLQEAIVYFSDPERAFHELFLACFVQLTKNQGSEGA